MGIQLKHITAATLAIATAIVTSIPPAFSQQMGDGTEVRTVPAGFEDVFFGFSGDYSDNRTTGSQFGNIFGSGGLGSASFPELDIERDAEALHDAYLVHLALQNTSDPTIRVPDLANPFTTTLLLMPSMQSSGPVVGSEFIYETSPMR